MPERARPFYRRLSAFEAHGSAAKLQAARCLFDLREFRSAMVELANLNSASLSADDRALRRKLLITCYTELGNPEAARRVMEEED